MALTKGILFAGALCLLTALGGAAALVIVGPDRERHSFVDEYGRPATYFCVTLHDGMSAAENAALSHAFFQAETWMTRSGQGEPGSLRDASNAELLAAAEAITRNVRADFRDLQRSLSKDYG